MADHFQTIYQTQAEAYDRLVSREDYQGNILKTLRQIRPFTQLTVVECGAGTGRLTEILLPEAARIMAFDGSEHMIQAARRKLAPSELTNWLVGAALNHQLPLPASVADVTLAGWSLAHSVGWYPENWRRTIGQMLNEMKRVTRPGGTIMLLETLGTGRETPMPPTLQLAEYYQWLEVQHGFNTTWFRTDYLFKSVEEGAELTRFFFGDNMAADVLARQLQILPECTGLWWWHKPGGRA